VGKDLSKFSLPVVLNEPITYLQKCAELMAFSDLLSHASKEENPYIRMAYVMTETLAQYMAHSRSNKKTICLAGR
jgi:hypothetical protein